MCQHFSFIATKDKLLAAYGVNSHEDLIQLFKLKDDTNLPYFVRCEFLPDNPMTLNFNNWTLKVDQDFRPDWFVESEWKDRAVQFLESQNHITEDMDIISGQYWYCTAKVGKMIGRASILYLLGSSQVGAMWHSSQVGEMRGSSQVGEMRGSSQVGEMRGSSRVGEMRGSSQVGAMWHSSQVGEMRGSSQVGAMGVPVGSVRWGFQSGN